MSKGLEALKEIKNSYSWTNPQREDKEQFDTIEKELKALEIIKNTDIEIWKIIDSKNYKEYIEDYCLSKIEYLTQGEYNLLKEVLRDDN